MFQWTRQLGTSSDDWSNGVSTDGLGNVYISGTTYGSLEGTNVGGTDAFISKYDANGMLQWTRQLGTSSDEGSDDVSADGLGNVYISCGTQGNLEGTNAGNYDAFLSKYDASGMFQWTRQLGTSSDDGSNGVSADGLGNVYISGITEGSLEGTNAGGWDVFVAKYSDTGDFDDDGDVDGADFLYWQLNDGSQSNLDLWQVTFGNVASPMSAASIGVPEPSSFMLLLVAFACSLRWLRSI
jgi:hypothetical protein